MPGVASRGRAPSGCPAAWPVAHEPCGRFPAAWRNRFTVSRHLVTPARGAGRQCGTMASLFSGALQLTDLDDFIAPSQVGGPGGGRERGAPSAAVSSLREGLRSEAAGLHSPVASASPSRAASAAGLT